MQLIDLSADIRPGMPKPPSAPEVSMDFWMRQSEAEERKKGYSNKLEQFTITTHVSTHFDAPSHFCSEGRNIDDYPLSKFYMVPTVVLDVMQMDYGEVSLAEIKKAEKISGGIRKGDLVIINTGFYRYYEEERYLRTPFLSVDAARYLVDEGMDMLAIDCFTVDDVRKREKPVHLMMLKEIEILIIEGVVNLDKIKAPRFHSICLPLKIKNGSGAFTRLTGVFEEEDK